MSANGLRVYVLCGGLLELDLALMLPDRAPGSRWTVPVPAFLVVHARGRLLFDTGVHRAAIADPVGRFGESRASRFGMRSRPGDDVVSQLALVGLRPDEVTWVANSHFHFDHCGGNEFFPRSTFLVQRREREAARDAAVLAEKRYTPSAQDFDHPLAYRPIDGEHDVFGDGTVVLIPTYGHTPGHQSLQVRTGKGGDLVLAADACYTRENMDRDLLPSVLWDAAEMARSLARLRDLRDRQGATIIFGHDPAQWRDLPRAPEPLAAALHGPSGTGQTMTVVLWSLGLAVVGLAVSRWGARKLTQPTPRALWIAGLPALLLAWAVPFVSLLNASGTIEGPPRKTFMSASAARSSVLLATGSSTEERDPKGGDRPVAGSRRGGPAAGLAGGDPRRPPELAPGRPPDVGAAAGRP